MCAPISHIGLLILARAPLRLDTVAVACILCGVSGDDTRPPSARALAAIATLPRRHVLQRLVRWAVPHRANRWHYVHGRIPDLGPAIRLHLATGGLVPIWGWMDLRALLEELGGVIEEMEE